MVGDLTDMLGRLRAWMPRGWFAASSPVVDVLLSGPSWMGQQTYALLGYVLQQARLSTATDVWLDVISQDFLGTSLPRRNRESDDMYRQRIANKVLEPKATREAVVNVLEGLVGVAPTIVEPANPTDCGGYNVSTAIGYGVAGYYGSIELPYQFFVSSPRPRAAGVAYIAGYGSMSPGFAMPGGYGVGALEYADSSQAAGNLSDADIYAAVSDVLAAGTVAWMRIGATAGQ